MNPINHLWFLFLKKSDFSLSSDSPIHYQIMMINVSFFCTASDGKILEVLMIQNKTAISKVSWRLDAKRNCKNKYIIEQTMGFKQLELKKTSYGRFGREKLTRININVTKKKTLKRNVFYVNPIRRKVLST